MSTQPRGNKPYSDHLHELVGFRDRTRVFRDRSHAGAVLAEMLSSYRGGDALVLAIPAGGVPVACEVARRLVLSLGVAVVSKVLLPWTTEAGFGAVAFDGSTWINRNLVARFGLTPEQVRRAVEQAREKVRRRIARFRGADLKPIAEYSTVIIVDDGVAAGSTLHAAVAALRRRGARKRVIAVPTGHADAVMELAAELPEVYCANLRHGTAYAVADAYETWVDVSEAEAVSQLEAFSRAS